MSEGCKIQGVISAPYAGGLMPKVDKVGFGKYTAQKMEILKSIFSMHLVVTQAVLNNRPAYR
jgi:hypothetical protein